MSTNLNVQSLLTSPALTYSDITDLIPNLNRDLLLGHWTRNSADELRWSPGTPDEHYNLSEFALMATAQHLVNGGSPASCVLDPVVQRAAGDLVSLYVETLRSGKVAEIAATADDSQQVLLKAISDGGNRIMQRYIQQSAADALTKMPDGGTVN